MSPDEIAFITDEWLSILLHAIACRHEIPDYGRAMGRAAQEYNDLIRRVQGNRPEDMQVTPQTMRQILAAILRRALEIVEAE